MTQVLDAVRKQVDEDVRYGVWNWVLGHMYYPVGTAVHQRTTRNGCWKYDWEMRDRINA